MSFTLYRPVKKNYITQKFGVNYLSIYKELGLLGHNGQDFQASNGDPVYFNSSGKGEVISVCDSWTKGLGVTVLINDNGRWFKLVFWHLKSYCVKEGDIVETGDLLGYADNSGQSTGPHLHFGMYYSNQYGATLQKDNGYGGALDPTPYFRNYFVLDVMSGLLQKKLSLLQKIFNLLEGK